MANIASAKKRARQTEKRRIHNTSRNTMLRTQIKKTVNAIEAGDKEGATKAYAAAVPLIDKMANKGLVTKNKAARHKSRLNSRIQALS